MQILDSAITKNVLPVFHQKILAHELTLKRPAHELKKLSHTAKSCPVPILQDNEKLQNNQDYKGIRAYKNPLAFKKEGNVV